LHLGKADGGETLKGLTTGKDPLEGAARDPDGDTLREGAARDPEGDTLRDGAARDPEGVRIIPTVEVVTPLGPDGVYLIAEGDEVVLDGV
jgi:hypothetical protein